jgi:hypothetical protein
MPDDRRPFGCGQRAVGGAKFKIAAWHGALNEIFIKVERFRVEKLRISSYQWVSAFMC